MVRSLFLIVCLVMTASSQHTDNLVHLPGCGCTTTTTCFPEVGTSSCPSGSPRPGKRGPVGPKGEKGAPVKSNERRIAQLQNRVDQLNDDLKVFWELSYAFPSSCSEYMSYETEHRKFAGVPLYLEKTTGNTTTIVANCTRLEEIRGPRNQATINVPFNSIQGRTFILKATPRDLDGDDWFNIAFSGNDSAIFFNIVVRLFNNEVARNDRKSWKWNAKENDLARAFPFSFDVPFTMKIVVDEVGYHCFVDGEKIFVFKHRQMPLSDLKYIEASGRLNITYMSLN